jgi:hypothetical protein
MEAQKVRIILELCGDYVAFHEISTSILYDLTNDVIVDDYNPYNSLEEIQSAMSNDRDYCDIQEVDAFLVNGEYYYQL